MQDKITPKYGYLLCKEVKEATGAVVPGDIADHWQKYEVLAVGDGQYNEYQNIWIEPVVEVGDVIYVQKHAEADSPPDLKTKGLYLILEQRVMAVVGK
jgi:co-chaperonin GroES (HSP10)